MCVFFVLRSSYSFFSTLGVRTSWLLSNMRRSPQVVSRSAVDIMGNFRETAEEARNKKKNQTTGILVGGWLETLTSNCFDKKPRILAEALNISYSRHQP